MAARVSVLMLAVVPLSAGLVLNAARADTWPVTPDEQKYATAWGTDPYQDQDVHVAVAGGLRQAVSYLHFDLDAVPSGSTLHGLVVSLTPNETPGHNVGGGSPLEGQVQACLETAPFPTEFDPTAAPSFYDCDALSAPVSQSDDGSWSADLTPFLTEWETHGNTGVALVGAIESSQSNWVVSFDSTKTGAQVTYNLAAAPATTTAAASANTEPATPEITRAADTTAAPRAEVATLATPATTPLEPPSPEPPASNAQAATAPEEATADSPQFALYGAVAFWAACATLLAVGTVMRLRTAEGFSYRALLDVVRRSVRTKSTWLAGVPLALVVFGGLGAVGYMVYLNNQVTPPLTFEAIAPETSPTPDQASDADTASTMPTPAEAVHSLDPADDPAAADAAGTVTATEATTLSPAPATSELDGRWVVGSDSVAGYRIGYSSPTGRGTRVGRTEDGDGVTGAFRLDGSTVLEAEFSVDMRKVYCDGGSTCTDHVNEMMDVENHPYETLVLSAPVELGTIPPDGQHVTSQAQAELTLRGVTRSVTFEVSSRRNGERIEVLGSIPVNRDDYEIPDANEPGFSVDKDGTIEVLLVFHQQGD